MTENPSPDPAPETKLAAKTEARAAEAAAIRRKWLTLGEVLAVAAVIISGLTLWNSWSERSDSQATKSAEAKQASTRAATLMLVATNSGDHELVLKPASADQSVQSQKIMFPTALGVAPAETTGEARIEASWFESALKTARNKAKLPDNSRGDERLPVAITTRFMAGGESHEDVALYDIGYTISGRLFGGHSVTLRGLSLVSHTSNGRAQSKIDALWKTSLPEK